MDQIKNVFDEDELERYNYEKINYLLNNLRSIENVSPRHLYLQLFEFLNIGNMSNEIPRIVVVGQQSMGKTTVIDMLIGHPLGYSSNDIGTCCPIVFHIFSSGNKSSYNSPSSTSTSYTLVGTSKLNEDGIIECAIDGQIIKFEELPQRILEKTREKNKNITSEELRIDIQSRDTMDMIIVDLPGLKDDTKEGAKQTQKIVQEYVSKHPNDIYILVKRSIDDPANWSWKQKKFLLEDLGLGCEQTIVVGTKALEYLQEEIKEIATANELLERIKKRELRYKNDERKHLPLYMLELFSLNKEERNLKDISLRKHAMNTRILMGNNQITEIINQICRNEQKEIKLELMKYFSIELFEKELKSKFIAIFLRQLILLEKIFYKKSSTILSYHKELPNNLLWRENIIMIIRNFVEIINEMVTGNFNVFEFKGDEFLEEHGGNLWMNLKEGKEMMNYYSKLNDEYTKLKSNNKENISQINNDDFVDEDYKSESNISENLIFQKPIKTIYVRQKKSPYLIGKYNIGNMKNINMNEWDQQLKIEFQYKKKDGISVGEHTKYMSRDQLVPLKKLCFSKVEPKNYYWHMNFKEDKWIGLTQIQVISKTNESLLVKINNGINYEESDIGINAILYVDSSWDEVYDNPFEEQIEKKMGWDSKSEIMEPLFDLLLLNEMSFTLLFKWFKQSISSVKPRSKYSEQTLYQMLRSISHVMSTSYWQPIVVDVLQMNIRETIIPLSNLLSYSCSVALKRIMKAALFVLRKESINNPCMELLFKSTEFNFIFEKSIEDYCLMKAKSCSETMNELITEQTSAIMIDILPNEEDNEWEKVYASSNSHFIKLKETLITPLCTKLYLNFVSDLKEIGIRHKEKLNIERYLNETLLSNIFNEDEIINKYNLLEIIKENENIKKKQITLKQYYSHVLKVIQIIKNKYNEEKNSI